MKQEVITMTRKEMNRYDIITKANLGVVTVKEAAEGLGITERQIKRLKRKVREEGATAVIHGNKNTTTKRKIGPELEKEVIGLKQVEPYKECNFKHFAELLEEYHGIKMSYSTVYKILTKAKINSPKKRRRYKPHRRRERRSQAGMLLQVDATPYQWFKSDRKYYALHGAIDDATGQITGLYMSKNECMQGYFEMMRRTIKNYGIPISLYADRHTIFQSPNKAKAEIDFKIPVNDTQFGRCLKELSVQLIPARSPQAKGRIERLWETLQSRLPIEFALRNIDNIDSANEFLESYILSFNSKFSVTPENADSVFFQLPNHLNLDFVLCVKEARNIDAGGIFSYGGKKFKVGEDNTSRLLPPNVKATVLLSPIFGIKVEFRNLFFDVSLYKEPKPVSKVSIAPKPSRVYPPIPDSHYLKYGKYSSPNLCDEDYSELMNMLQSIFLKQYA
jgi:transposase